jgi:hypothetical protein
MTAKKKPKSQTGAISIKQLFRERMGREGKSAELKAAVKAVMKERNLKYGQAIPEAMRRMGYEGPEKERQHEREWIQGMDYERAMCYLPKSATPEVENNWVKSHPAMTRKNLASRDDGTIDADGRVKISACDLFFAPHGRCPSMGAAVKLVTWANNSKALDTNLAAGVKKSEQSDGGEAAAKSETVKDDGIEELKRLLDEVA